MSVGGASTRLPLIIAFNSRAVHARLALEMIIIGDHIRGLRPLGDALDSFFPAREFTGVVEIVVAVVAIIGIGALIGKPVLVVAAVQSDVTDRSRDVSSVGASVAP